MKKTNKENPLTFFRKANESRQKVVKNSLTKARFGQVVNSVVPSLPPVVAGPQTEMQSILSNAMNSQPPIPRPNRPSRNEMIQGRLAKSYPWENTNIKEPRPIFMDSTDPRKEKKIDQNAIDDFKKQYPNGIPGPSSIKLKKGGSVKRKK
jgi:hypothetical protein